MTTQTKDKRTDLNHVDPNSLIIIGFDTQHKSVVDHPQWDPRSSLPVEDSMVQNVLKYGIIQPVRCISVGKGETHQRLVIAGRQRVKAARLANEILTKEGSALKILVPVMLESGADEARTFGVRISENEIRRDDSVLIKASNAVDMANRFGCSRADIAQTFGVSQATISQWFKLNSLQGEVKTAVAKGQLTIAGALQFADVPKEVQAVKLAEILATKKEDPSDESIGDLTPNPSSEAPKTKPVKKSEAEVKQALSGKETLPAPTKTELKAILKAFDESKVELEDGVVLALRIIVGELEPKGKSPLESALKKLRKGTL